MRKERRLVVYDNNAMHKMKTKLRLKQTWENQITSCQSIDERERERNS